MKAPTNAEVSRKSELVRVKYGNMTFTDANLEFAYELQGFIKAMVVDHHQDMNNALAKVGELLFMIDEAQKPGKVNRWR
jgi:hypothetical protein